MTRDSTTPILYAEDDRDDWMLMQMAHGESEMSNPIVYLNDGQEVIEYLRAEGAFAGARRPGIILLDLNMPRLDGRATLQWIKRQPSFRDIPTIVLTTSDSEKDIAETYAAGASTYIVKPSSFSSLVAVLNAIDRYWFRIASLPGSGLR